VAVRLVKNVTTAEKTHSKRQPLGTSPTN